MRRTGTLLGLASALVLAGCASQPPVLETFDWVGHPIQLLPPSKDWYRSGWNEGGWLGVDFTHSHGAGERIMVAEHQIIAHRDGRPKIAQLTASFASYDEGQLREELQLARYRTDNPLSAQEADVAGRVNEALDGAVSASYQRDTTALKQELLDALADAGQLQLTLADCLQRVTFRPEYAKEPERWTEKSRRDGTVAGVPALIIDYAYKGDDREYVCRDVYFSRDNRLFIASYFGLSSNMWTFDRVVGSIQLPAWDPAQP